MKLSIIIPAHNEQDRIGRTLDAYHEFFARKSAEDVSFSYEFVVVLSGCTDHTLDVIKKRVGLSSEIFIVNSLQSGKGLAVKLGFENALIRNNDLIGFVDADMATRPQYFYDLVEYIDGYDGIIADRYMPGAKVFPKRPAIKAWGRKIIYQPLVWLLFGLRFDDYQCGAKLFTRRVIEVVTPLLTVNQWAFDVELLYLCKVNGFKIKSWPTVWYDQAGSKLHVLAEHRMLTALIKARWRHAWLYKKFFLKS